MTATDSGTPGSGTPGDATPTSAPAGGATADDAETEGERPGDIPFDQATAEHENPDLA
ncbi:hypothetical protein ACPPVQ_12220 [Diaminobutyricibacter sp. McL0618]|uniref:hypothetical protein n=1 Tax=Leifsonia sp. McL0618 TaxID=3415677 RepID=UPI003CF1668B